MVAARAGDDPRHVRLDALYEGRASTTHRVPVDVEDVLGDRCEDGPERGVLGALGEGSVVHAADVVDRGLGVTQDTLVWSTCAGGAVGADVRAAGGRTCPAVVFDGQLFGWVPVRGDDVPSAVITACDAHGTVIGHVDLAGVPTP